VLQLFFGNGLTKIWSFRWSGQFYSLILSCVNRRFDWDSVYSRRHAIASHATKRSKCLSEQIRVFNHSRCIRRRVADALGIAGEYWFCNIFPNILDNCARSGTAGCWPSLCRGMPLLTFGPRGAAPDADAGQQLKPPKGKQKKIKDDALLKLLISKVSFLIQKPTIAA